MSEVISFLRKVSEVRWKRDVAIEHFKQVSGALAGQQGGGVHERESALRLECCGEGFAGFDAIGNVIELRGEVGVFLALGQHLDEPRIGRPARMRVRNC